MNPEKRGINPENLGEHPFDGIIEDSNKNNEIENRPILRETKREREIRILFENAEWFQEKGDFPTALTELKKIIKIEPTNHKAIFQIASIYSRMGQSKDAIFFFEKEIKYYPPNQDGRKEKGWGKIDKTNSILMQRKEGESQLDFKIRNIEELVAAENLELALEYAEELQENYPEDVKLLYLFGTIYFKMSKFPESIECNERAMKLDPSNRKENDKTNKNKPKKPDAPGGGATPA